MGVGIFAFIVGVIFGIFSGMIIMALCSARKQSDISEYDEYLDFVKEKSKSRSFLENRFLKCR